MSAQIYRPGPDTYNVCTLWAMHIGLMAKLQAQLLGQNQNISCQVVDRSEGCGHGVCVDWGVKQNLEDSDTRESMKEQGSKDPDKCEV